MKKLTNSQMGRSFFRGLPIVMATTLLNIVIAKKYLSYVTPMYESTSKIKLADIHEGIPNSNLYKDLDVFVNTNKITAEVELIKSKVLVRKVLKQLNLDVTLYRVGEIHRTELYADAPFYVKALVDNRDWLNRPFSLEVVGDSLLTIKTPSGQVLKTAFNKIISVPGGTFSFLRNNALLKRRPGLQLNDQYEFIVNSANRLEDAIIAGLDVMSVDKDVPVIRISYKSAVPQKAADVVNALSAAYIADYIDDKYKSADTTSQFLEGQLDTFSHKLSASENAVEGYRNKENIINIRQETETDLRKIADLKKQLANVQMNLNAIDSLNNYMSDGHDRFLELAPNFEAFTDLLSTELIKKIKELQREKRDLLVKYTPEHEKVKVIDGKLSDISSYLQESIRNTDKSLHIQYHDLENSIAEAEKVFIGLPTREKNMTILERNFNLNEDIYRFLHQKRTEAEIAKAATISFHRIISEGEVPVKPISPNYSIIKILAALLGVALGVGLIYVMRICNARVGSANTVYRSSATPLMASVPLFTNPAHESSYFRKWALELELKQMLPVQTVICISSFSASEGKSFIAEELSNAIISLEKKVILVNAAAVVASAGENPSGWQQYIQSLLASFDIVVIDNFPVSRQSVAMVPMLIATVNMFILDAWKTPERIIEKADDLAADLQVPNWSFVLNRPEYSPYLWAQAWELMTSMTKKFRK